MSLGRSAVVGLLLAFALVLPQCGGGGEGGARSCRSVLECPAGQQCLNGVCSTVGGSGEPRCATDADCTEPGTTCQDGTCRAEPAGPCSCAPEDPCTATAPECVVDPCPIVGEDCAADGECDDGEACTLNTCLCGYCETERAPEEGCCLADADCDDDLDCSTDTCLYFQCEHSYAAGCCTSDAQCDDHDPCTADRCTAEGCVNEGSGMGCCVADDDCDDGEPCTRDACVEGSCVHPRDAADPLCGCLSAAMCDDGNPCTEDYCEEKVCSYKAGATDPPGMKCCRYDSDCDDDQLGTREICDHHVCRYEARRACGDTPDCEGADPCWQTTCAGGFCVEAGEPTENCCVQAADCDDGDRCTADNCLSSNRCQHIFEMQPGCCTLDGQCDDDRICTSEYCCLDDRCCGGGGCFSRNHCVYSVIQPGDEACCLDDEGCDDDLPCTLDLCVNGTCHNLAPAGACCQSDHDCDDQNDCTTDTCSDGRCDNLALPSCCRSDGDCDDGNACTTDTCIDDTCRHDWLPDCCGSAGECNDHDVCTVDRCEEGSCEHQDLFPCCELDEDCTSDDACLRGACVASDCVYSRIEGCCHDAGECDDGDVCTADFCVASLCHHSPEDTPECCEATIVWQNGGFEMGPLSLELDEWEVVNQTFGLGWQVVSGARSVSAPYALYYGDATTHDYGSGLPHTGSARTPPVTLPNEDAVFATFWTYVDTAGDPTADFHVSVVAGPAYRVAQPVWYHTAIGSSTEEFRFIELDLSPWRGQTVRLEFFFRTETTSQSAGEGIYVDDIELGAGCILSPVDCQRAEDCADADPCTVAACLDQSCDLETVSGPTCCAARLFAATFDDGTVQGVATGRLPGTSEAYGWTPSTARSSSAPSALYFGDPDRSCPGAVGELCPAYGDDLNPEPAGGTADIGPLNLSALANPILRFDLWADIDPILAYDHLDLVLVSLPTEAETILWSTSTSGMQNTGGIFQQVVIDLEPRSTETVKLRFRFDTSGDGFGYGEGAYLDDIAVGERCD